ncbi:hypothetical protein [Candidatus Pelagibacter sp.]|uniref:hypothetical protein n=1 Tax=Candidatus Pelagibacter sp. TaxID=2024849 RepID=UPI003F8376A3
MKFKIIPADNYDISTFTKDDKAIMVDIRWGRIDYTELDETSSELFENCKTIEEVQKVVDDVVSKCVPVTENKKLEYYDEYWSKSLEHDVYDSMQLTDAFKFDVNDEIFLNTSSGGGANTEMTFHKNITTEEFETELEFDGETLTLEEAAESWRDQFFSENGWLEDSETYYRAPLKVVEVKE